MRDKEKERERYGRVAARPNLIQFTSSYLLSEDVAPREVDLTECRVVCPRGYGKCTHPLSAPGGVTTVPLQWTLYHPTGP